MTPCNPRIFALASLIFSISLQCFAAPTCPTEAAHNVILFVPDGLRAVMVDARTAPAMAALRDHGVNFRNSHSLFPTFTTANASAFATGHHLGDTGDWSNTIYTGFPVSNALDSPTPFIENDAILGELDRHFGGDYLDEETLLAAARGCGYGTAAIGKQGPVLIQDHTARDGQTTIVIDDSTGRNDPSDGPRRGIPLAKPIADALVAAGVGITAPGTSIPNVDQQQFFADAFTKVVLPTFKARGKPFFAVFWSRDPDGSQHGQDDGHGKLVPGINGISSLMGIKNADGNLEQIRNALAALDLDKTTDILVAADHGFSTVGLESETSVSAKMIYDDVPPGLLPNGFVAIDLAHALHWPLFDPDSHAAKIQDGEHPKRGHGLIGPDSAKPEVVVTANGGSELIYLPLPDAGALAPKIVDILLQEDYVSGIFVRDDLGRIPGTLPFSAINLSGAAVTPVPAISISFKSFSTGCDNPLRCTVEVSDTNFGQGHGMHGSFSRADTYNFQAAIGPDFKSGVIDEAPSSNADIGMTIASILKIKPKAKGKLLGRVLSEAFPGGVSPKATRRTVSSSPAENGLRTIVETQSVGDVRYFDAGGFLGRTVGLSAVPPDAQ